MRGAIEYEMDEYGVHVDDVVAPYLVWLDYKGLKWENVLNPV